MASVHLGETAGSVCGRSLTRSGYLTARQEDENNMNNLAGLRYCTFAVVATLLLLTPIGIAQGANPTHFEMTVIGQTLTAGFNNNVTVGVTYPLSAYFSGSAYDVDLAVSIPSPLQLLGDDHWRYDLITPGQSVTVSFEVYAPTAAIGESYQGSITLAYRELGEISYTEETHTVGFSVQGWVNLVLYGIQVTPSATTSGGNATVSGNLLNSGNLAVYNANVTVESEALAPGAQASVFLGEVDPNIPRPFSLLVSFRKDLAEGTYSIVIKISAIDTNRPASPYTAQKASQIQIKKATVQSVTEPRQASGVVGTILEILRYLLGLFFGSQSLSIPLEWPLLFSGDIRASGLGS